MNLNILPKNGHTLFPNSTSAPTLLSCKKIDSYHNEAPSLNPPQLDLVQHLQGVSVAAVPQDQNPAITLDTLCRHFLEKLLDAPPAQRAALQKLHRQVLILTNSTSDPASLGKKEAKDCYEYFKAAQKAFDELSQTCGESERSGHQEQRDLCRMLKWQFRASRDQRSKTVLDQALAKSRATVAEGGSMGNHVSLGVGVGALGAVSIVPSLKLSTELGTTQGRIIKATTSGSAGVKAKLSAKAASLQVGAELEKSTVRKYANIAGYADARSLSKWTWWNGSKRDMLSQSHRLFASCNHYKRHIRLAAQSRPHLEKELQGKGFDLKFEQHKPKAQPFQIERGTRVALTGSVQFEGLGVVTAGATAKADVLLTTKNQAMDIIDLYDWSPELAKPYLGSPLEYDTAPKQLIKDLKSHVAESSEERSRAQLKNLPPQERDELNKKLDDQTGRLLKQYIQLRNSGEITEDSDENRTIRQLLEEHPMLLRPDSLKLYTTKADTETRTLSAEAKLKVDVGVSAEAGVKVSLSSVKDDDPHLSGTYLDLELSGQLNTLESLQNLISIGLSQAGVNSFDPAPVVALVAGTVLYQSHGVSAKFSLKIKDGKPTLLLSQQIFTQKDNVNQTIDTPSPLTVEVGFGGHLNTLLSEQLGSQSLGLVLPLALAKLGKRTEAGKTWWDGYVKKHAESFDNLLKNIANDSEETAIRKEIAEIKSHISPEKQHVVEDLVSAVKASHETPSEQTLHQAREAFKEMLLAYIDDYYDAKVKEAWRVE